MLWQDYIFTPTLDATGDEILKILRNPTVPHCKSIRIRQSYPKCSIKTLNEIVDLAAEKLTLRALSFGEDYYHSIFPERIDKLVT